MERKTEVYKVFTFFLDKKSNKKVKRVRCGTFRGNKISYAELAIGRDYYWKSLRFETPLRAIIRFLEALNFSLYAFSYLMLLQVKNEALGESLSSKRWHLS
jgi:hypothetical protein